MGEWHLFGVLGWQLECVRALRASENTFGSPSARVANCDLGNSWRFRAMPVEGKDLGEEGDVITMLSTLWKCHFLQGNQSL